MKPRRTTGRIEKRHGGFVLVMVLVVLTLASILLAGIARRSLARAVEAMTAQADLQRRWGMLSCQRAILGQARQILEPQPVKGQPRIPPKSRQELKVVLGGAAFELLLADEEAKVNLNRVHAKGGPSEVRRQIARLSRGSDLGVQLRASRSTERPASKQSKTQAAQGSEEEDERFSTIFGSWGQVFDTEATEDVRDIPTALADATTSLTCWGEGRLNLRTAEDQVFRSAMQRIVPAVTISRFLDLRSKNPDLKSKELVSLMKLDEAERKPLENWLTDSSRCHSLWITVRGSERARHELFIRESMGEGRSRTSTFVW